MSLAFARNVLAAVDSPFLRRTHSSVISTLATARTWAYFGRHHTARLRPFQLIEVDPSEITQMFDTEEYFDHPMYTAEVKGGDWSDVATPLEAYDLYCSFVAHFDTGVPWEETEFYQRVRTEMARPDWSKWGCETLADFESRLTEIDRLYERMRQDGYKRQRELLAEPNSEQLGYTPTLSMPPELFEVTVVIDRDGEVLFHYQGRHRLTIAKILELPTIPVRVRARHSEWQAKRDAVADSGPLVDRTHPDLRSV